MWSWLEWGDGYRAFDAAERADVAEKQVLRLTEQLIESSNETCNSEEELAKQIKMLEADLKVCNTACCVQYYGLYKILRAMSAMLRATFAMSAMLHAMSAMLRTVRRKHRSGSHHQTVLPVQCAE